MSKRTLMFLVLLGALFPRASFAQRTSEITIDLELNSDFWIVAKLTDSAPKEGVTLGCSATWKNRWQARSFELTGKTPIEIGRVRVGDDTPDGDSAQFVRHLLGDPPSCYRIGPGKTTTPVSVSVSKLKLANDVKKDISSALTGLSPGIDWFAFRPPYGAALRSLLGAPVSCTIDGAPNARCTVSGVDDESGRISLDVGDAAGVKKVLVTFPGAAQTGARTVEVSVAPCTFHATGRMPYLVAGAAAQTLLLASPRRECEARLDRIATVAASGTTIGAVAVPDLLADGGRRVELSSVPATLTPGVQTYTLKANQGTQLELGSLGIQVLEKLSAGDTPDVRVTYEVYSPGAPDALPVHVNKGIASISPQTLQYGVSSEDRIWNTVVIPFKAPLPQLSEPRPAQEAQKLDKLPPDTVVGAERRSSIYWRVQARPGQIEWRGCAERDEKAGACPLEAGPRELVFTVKSETVGSVEAGLELVERVDFKTRKQPADVDLQAAYHERVLLRATVPLAGSAQRESVILPLRDRLLVDCQGSRKYVFNSDTRAINDEAVVDGRCAIVYLPVGFGRSGPPRYLSVYEDPKSDIERDKVAACEKNERGARDKSADAGCEEVRKATWRTGITGWLDALDPKGDRRRINAFYGPQRFIVTVKRDGKELATRAWELSPIQPTYIELPNAGETTRGNLYTVEVRPAARPTSGVNWVKAVVDDSTAAGDNPHPEHRFSAQLRSRGVFGWRCWPIRTYITVPVQLLGFRIPAATAELRKSSDATRFQYLTPRTGVFLMVEPWDYDSGQNIWPMNPSLAFGLMAFELTKPQVALSTMLGVQVKTAFLDLSSTSSQLRNEATLGAFWEHDIQGKEHRFIVTVGANLLSLFSGH